MKTWICADWHLGERRFDIMMRPFVDQQQMIDCLLICHNNMVAKDDIVFVVGDAVNKDTPEFLPWIKEFNGVKTLIRGNHDRPFKDKDLAPYFEKIVAEGDGIEINAGDIPCYMTHYPTSGRVNRFNLVGHVHSAWKFQLNSLNVGVDTNHFMPYNLDDIPFYFKAINEFYDEDVWAGYNACNMAFVNTRGKKGHYFTKPTGKQDT